MGLIIVLVRHVLQRRRRHHDVLLRRDMAHVVLVRRHDEAVGDFGWRRGDGRVDVFQRSAGNGLPGSHVAVVDVRL